MNQAKRQFALDIETTGLSPGEGHRIVEIAAIELLDGAVTGHYFHHRLNPECEIEEKVSSIIGLTWDILKNESRFSEVAHEFLEFIAGAELIMHHASFDLGFLNAELSLSGLPALANPVIDTLKMAWELHPTEKNHLNALCERYHIDQTHPVWDGLLLDVKVIADVYLAMSEDRNSFVEEGTGNSLDSTEEGEGKLLDLAEARCFAEKNQMTDDSFDPCMIDLYGYRRATPAALEFLAMQEGYRNGEVILGVDNLDEVVAGVLVRWNPKGLEFSNIRSLNESVALILAKSDSKLSFENLDGISPITARVLARTDYWLRLCLGNISIDVANELIKHQGCLLLSLKNPPSESILHALINHSGSSTSIHWQSSWGSEPFAFKLPKGKKLRSGSSTFILPTEHRFEHLWIVCDSSDCMEAVEVRKPEYKHLDLVEAKRFYEETFLIRCAQDEFYYCIQLDYTSATHEALEFLVSHIRGHNVILGLRELDADLARILCRWDGHIEIAVEHLNIETALILSERVYGIDFNRAMLQIGPKVARALAKLKPSLLLTLDELSVDVAQELVKKPGDLCLWVVTPPTEQILHILCEYMGSATSISWSREAGDTHPCDFKPSHKILESKKVTIGFDLSSDGAWIDRVDIRNLDNEE